VAEDAQEAVYKAKEEYDNATRALEKHDEALKVARKVADRATISVDETKKAVIEAGKMITKADTRANDATIKASETSRRAYETVKAREDAEEKFTAADDQTEDLEGIWLERHLKKVRHLEGEFKKAQQAASKAKYDEQAAETASVDAQAFIKKTQADLVARKKEATDALVAVEETGTALSEATKAFEDAAKMEATLKVTLASLTKDLKVAQAKAKKTTVQGAEQDLEAAKQAVLDAARKQEDKTRLAVKARDAMAGPVAESYSAAAEAKERGEAAEAAGQAERDAMAKETLVEPAIADFEETVAALALEVYAARFEQPAFWTAEENTDKARIAHTERLSTASRDLRAVAAARDRAKNQVLSPVDKWLLFKQALETGEVHTDTFHVTRLLYDVDGNVLPSVAMMVSAIITLGLDRGPPCVSKCKVEGNGLSQATVNQVTTFSIISCGDNGKRFDDGGDTFRVAIRYSALGRQNARPKITDHDDGQYTVSFKPSSAGKCTIHVMLLSRDGSETVELPGSPFTCAVFSFSGPPPVPSMCEVSGDALTNVVAQQPETLCITFRDALGGLTHATDLDVWVQPIPQQTKSADVEGLYSVPGTSPMLALSSGDETTWPPELSQLLENGQLLEDLNVGHRPLDVSITPEVDSTRIARLQPGRRLKLDKPAQSQLSNGLLRVRVLLELEDLEPKDGAAWRTLWPQQQSWRSLSWRAHTLAEARREEKEAAEEAALAQALRETARLEQAATAIEARARGIVARQRTRVLKRELAASRAAEAAKAAAEAAEQTAMKAKLQKKRAKEPQDSGRPGKEKPPKDAAPKAKPAKDSKRKKSKAASEEVVAAKEVDSSEVAAAIRVQAFARRASVCRMISQEKERVAALAPASAPAAATAAQKTKRGAAPSKLKHTSPPASGAKRLQKSPSSSRSSYKPASARGADAPTSLISRSNLAAEHSQLSRPPLTLNVAQTRKKLYGWITIATEHDVLVTKHVGRLPVKVRQEQHQLWNRSAAIDSQRERERARFIDEANEAAVTRPQSPRSPRARSPRPHSPGRLELTDEGTPDTPFKAAGSPLRHLIPNDLSKPFSPRVSYATLTITDKDDDEARRLSFAYGGVFPGRKSVREPPENHQVRFSIGKPGSYLLFVALRQPHTPWLASCGKTAASNSWQISGSPFRISVVPGKAYPLSTSLTPTPNETLRGRPMFGNVEGYSCVVLLETRDKMGNQCKRGGANVTCGFLGVVGDMIGRGRDQVADGSTARELQSTTCVDRGNGIYQLQWTSAVPGAFTAYAKIDGLHIIGSPARLLFVKAEPKAGHGPAAPKES